MEQHEIERIERRMRGEDRPPPPDWLDPGDRKQLEKVKRKLEGKLERAGRRAAVDPEPELSPVEARERALAARLDRLEQKDRIFSDPTARPIYPTEQEAIWEDHLRLVNRHLANLDERDRIEDHRHRHRRQIARAERDRAEVERLLDALNEREARAEAEWAAERFQLAEQKEAAEKRLAAIERPLELDEASTERLVPA